MKAIMYSVLFHVTCPEEPQLKLVGVCNYTLYVTEERIKALHGQLTREMTQIGGQYNAPFMVREVDRVLNIDVPYEPLNPAMMERPPEPGSGPLARLPKNINTCINVGMKCVHRALYELTKPVG